jgi:hypothetical protein
VWQALVLAWALLCALSVALEVSSLREARAERDQLRAELAAVHQRCSCAEAP